MRNVVHKVFQDLLGRAPSEGVARDWSLQLEEGASHSTLASCLLHSEENRERVISKFYLQFLGRAPGAETLLYWKEQNQEDLLAALLAGEEYFDKNGKTPALFVRALFRDLLKRFPTISEIEAWVGLMSSHSATREDVVRDFLEHEEYRALLVKEWFWLYLRRLPDGETVDHWMDRWRNGMTRETVQIGILSSREYLFTAS